MIGLQPGEISIMHALADGRWRTGVELAGLTDLPPFSVRSMLAELRRRQLVQRGQDVDSVGTWSLTSTGHAELSSTLQLRLV
jgi:DNA-binding IclR family transcriptional regulator